MGNSIEFQKLKFRSTNAHLKYDVNLTNDAQKNVQNMF